MAASFQSTELLLEEEDTLDVNLIPLEATEITDELVESFRKHVLENYISVLSSSDEIDHSVQIEDESILSLPDDDDDADASPLDLLQSIFPIFDDEDNYAIINNSVSEDDTYTSTIDEQQTVPIPLDGNGNNGSINDTTATASTIAPTVVEKPIDAFAIDEIPLPQCDDSEEEESGIESGSLYLRTKDKYSDYESSGGESEEEEEEEEEDDDISNGCDSPQLRVVVSARTGDYDDYTPNTILRKIDKGTLRKPPKERERQGKESMQTKFWEKEKLGPITTSDDGKLFYENYEILASDGRLNCSACDFSTMQKNVSKMQRHIRGEHMGAYFCTICNKKFLQMRLLRRHINRHSGEPKTTCKICGKPFKEVNSVRKHIWLHKSEEEKREAEAAGEKQPPSYHENQAKHKFLHMCQSCGKLFKHKCILIAHEKSHVDRKARQSFPCPECGKLLSSSSSLKSHMKFTHFKEKIHTWYECPTCHKSFSAKGPFQRHVRIHTGEKPFHCQMCTKSFATSTSLKLHTLTHSEERAFSCDRCGKSYRNPTHLQRHRKASHS